MVANHAHFLGPLKISFMKFLGPKKEPARPDLVCPFRLPKKKPLKKSSKIFDFAETLLAATS